ncbi:MAG: response regulator [Anaerolineae bacterium]
MAPPEPHTIPDELLAEVRDALAHYYDQAHLVRHPLLQRLQPSLGTDPLLATQELRRLLAQAIQELRPRPDTPLSDPAWRPYWVLHRRYILAKELAEVERELALGKRQIMREQRKGLEAVALALRQRQASGSTNRSISTVSNPLAQEISRIAADQQGIEAGALLRGALDAVSTLAQRYGVSLHYKQSDKPTYSFCNPPLFRQLLVAVLSYAVRSVPGGEVLVEMAASGQQTNFSCTAIRAAPAEIATVAGDLPESVLALAEAQGLAITIEPRSHGFRLQVSLPAADQERVVAIVEDNEDVVQLFSRYLAGRGIRLVHLDDSTQALARISELMPDAVVLDVMMSDVDGWEILQKLKADARLSQTPVVVCSVLDEPELALAIGADAYLRKPVRSAQLLDCLSRLLAQ